ncbi:DUF262 domain-containing protein [Anabaenopsis arnoldii]|uniref:DUF262 domain-containing protein n=1 Tax=Anabaenopsis arnoldii TaxID=2152938 RepID=A0ABT5ASC9_9CYAN|nr:DUF262 domain-containing protein [Anabaenopsis arnoldii]MDB9540214.1 DUF262 domain-containing protein [Anabaenopsis arnoldii]MDH6092612.1 DUF262 domain-containing HNH endonuclease family protein [Anabaenopsis arnoldii]
MQASETKLQHIIEGTIQYVVPLFQRAYSWKKSEWQVLWDDIAELCSLDHPRPHFMGSIVTMQTASGPEEGVNKFLLIDGQQRLTTSFILLCALRDKAKQSRNKQLGEEIHQTILVNHYKKGSDYYKLMPTQLDRTAFYRIINNESPIENNVISECYLFFERKIRNSKLEVEKIKRVICNNLSVVSVKLSNEDDPYLVFENLNAKGRPLTEADLIRNYFFMRIDVETQEEVYKKYWSPMEDILGENLTEFVRHYLTKIGKEIKQNQIYFEIKDLISKGEGDAISHLKDLYIFANYYAKLLNPEREENESIRKYLHRINRLKTFTVYPFLLNCYDELSQDRISEEDFVRILKIIENFILRRFICNIPTRGLNRVFALLYSQVSKDSNLAADSFLVRLKSDLQSRNYPKDEEFKSRLMDVNLYGGENRYEKAKLILESVEEYFQHKEQVSFDKLSIEHIMPQTLNDWWKQHLGEDWESTHQLLIHSLGNLTLTAYNGELSNDDFPKKQTHFQKSHLELNKYFHNKKSWCRKDIEKRGEYLAEIALQIWSYFGDESKPSHQSRSSRKSRSSRTTPKLLHIFEQEYPVKSWRDVLEITLNKIIDREPDRFRDIIEQFPRFVGWDEKKFRGYRKLDNGAFCEVNLSANDIRAFCQKAIETAEISEEWYFYTVDDK